VTEYRFVTEGRIGGGKKAEKFFASLNTLCIPDDPLAELADGESLHRIGNQRLSDRQLFDYIARSLWNKREEDLSTAYRRT
jgi:hypothetical protein